MANFHFHAKIIGRSQGRSAVGSAAYRAGVVLVDRRPTVNLRFDYTHKKGIDGAEILAPSNAPVWCSDRSELWNRVEEAEKRKDAQVCREVEFSLPVELTNDEKKELARDFVRSQFVGQGMVADVAFHHLDGHNPHAHVLLTMRELLPDGTGFGNKQRAWNEWALVETWREQWASHANAALAKAGHDARIDHRSLAEQANDAAQRGDMQAAQALDRTPTIHVGGNKARAAHNETVRAENVQRQKAWDETAEQARAEARLMAPSYDTPPHTPQPPRRAFNGRRHRATTIDRAARDVVRVRKPDDGRQPLLALRSLDMPNLGLPSGRGRAAESIGAGRVLRGDEPRHYGPGSPVQQLRAEAREPVNIDDLTEQREKRRERLAKLGTPPVAASARPKAPGSSTRVARAPRLPSAGGGSTRTQLAGDGTKQGDKLAKAGERWLRDLDKIVAELIRTALEAARQQSDLWEQAKGRDLIHAGRVQRVREWQDKKAERKHTKAVDSRIRRSQRRAGAEHDLETSRTDRLMMKLTGAEPKRLRDLREKEARAKTREAQAKKEREATATAYQSAVQDFDRRKQAFMAASPKGQTVPPNFSEKPQPKPTSEATPTMPPAPWAAQPPTVEEQAKKPLPPRM